MPGISANETFRPFFLSSERFVLEKLHLSFPFEFLPVFGIFCEAFSFWEGLAFARAVFFLALYLQLILLIVLGVSFVILQDSFK